MQMLNPNFIDRFSAAGVTFECADELRSHKKWLPYVEQGHTKPTVLADDDALYPSQWFEQIIAEDRSDAFVSTRCHRWVRGTNGTFPPYDQWEKLVSHQEKPSYDNFVTTGHGAVLRPDRIERRFRDRNKIMTLCPKADDIWLNLAHRAVGIPAYKTCFTFPGFEIPGSEKNGLSVANVGHGGNDQQLKAAIAAGMI
jgi:hypothetical protein